MFIFAIIKKWKHPLQSPDDLDNIVSALHVNREKKFTQCHFKEESVEVVTARLTELCLLRQI